MKFSYEKFEVFNTFLTAKLYFGSKIYLLPEYSFFLLYLHLIFIIIAKYETYIDLLKESFKDRETFEGSDIVEFFKSIDNNIKTSTVNWRIYNLVQTGILKRIGRGKLTLGNGKIYIPEISIKIKSINKKLKKAFPYLNFCIWSTSSINEFMIHQPGRFYILVEVEKDATESVFYFLKEEKLPVFIEPTTDIIEKYLFDSKETLIVKPLVTEAPLQKIEGINTITLEKMLVDIFCDNVIFAAQQGSELRTIYQEALTKYSVNENRMLRYANRRRKKDSLQEYLNSFSNLRQQD
jgi:hypothetical protein